jgi:peptide subunit release factor 1 (eRF1)
MLDELLGRADLKERVAELEAENESLAAQLDAERERRAEVSTARQEAEERVNHLEDRVTELEDRVERAESDESDLSFRGRAELRGERLGEVLRRLRSLETEPEGALTAFVDGDAPEAVREALGERATLAERAAPCLVCADDEGLVSVALTPPVSPEPFTEWGEGFYLEEAWFRPTGRTAVSLVRADTFALGVYEGSEQVAFEGFSADVKSDHSKGGFSQGRFERRRDAQIAEHVENCEEALENVDAERLFLVGERTVLDDVEADAEVRKAVDATGAPEAALADAVHEFWTTRLALL